MLKEVPTIIWRSQYYFKTTNGDHFVSAFFGGARSCKSDEWPMSGRPLADSALQHFLLLERGDGVAATILWIQRENIIVYNYYRADFRFMSLTLLSELLLFFSRQPNWNDWPTKSLSGFCIQSREMVWRPPFYKFEEIKTLSTFCIEQIFDLCP